MDFYHHIDTDKRLFTGDHCIRLDTLTLGRIVDQVNLFSSATVMSSSEILNREGFKKILLTGLAVKIKPYGESAVSSR